MEETVVCPNCGESNPADMVFCQSCQWRLRTLDGRSDSGAVTSSEAPAESLPEWLLTSRDDVPAPGKPAAGTAKVPEAGKRPEPAADLLAGLASQAASDDEDIPDWVAQITGVSTKDHASGPDAGNQATEEAQPLELDSASPPQGQGGEGGELEDVAREEAPPSGDASGTNDEIYNWLRQLDAATAQDTEDNNASSAEGGAEDVPDWVKELGGAPRSRTSSPTARSGKIIPDWLKAFEAEEPGGPETGALDHGIPMDQAADTPVSGPPAADEAVPAQSLEGGQLASIPKPTSPVTPAFTADGFANIDVNAVLASMQMPDWLADVGPVPAAPAEGLPPAAEEPEPIQPAELPSWVQAMRPVEPPSTTDQIEGKGLGLEQQGPLLGLHGVLPAIPGAGQPSSKPKAHSMKLEVTEQQEAHAALLEEMLASESTPSPMRAVSMPAPQRALRWAIGALLLIVLGGTVLSGSSIFPLPAAVPNETIQAVSAVESIAPSSHVLVVFDYEPATSGEMEATAAGLMDHMLLLRHPQLAIISSSPTGAALAEHFMSTVLSSRSYARGSQYADLGYLPGGLAGVRAFAQDPAVTLPLGAASDPIWQTDPLRGVTRLSDFAAIIVLTDGLESGRTWIEQTSTARGSTPMLIVCSAQVGPMFLPYVSSKQVSGLVAGINGAAGAEMANGGLPGYVRRYWDAYSLGIYSAVMLMTLGGFWHLWMGIRERRLPQA